MFDPYKEAQKHDDLINSLLLKNPVNKENARAWITFIRTVQTTFKIIKSTEKIILSLKGRHTH